MSVLLLSQQTQIRLPKIKVGLLQRKTREQIGVNCHVSEKTIRRDIAGWVRTPDFEEWLNEAWLNEYQDVNHSEAFRALTMLMGKKITHKIEAKTVQRIEVDKNVSETVTLIRRYEEVITRANDRNLQQNHSGKQVDTHQAQAAST